MSPGYREFTPRPELRNRVACVWAGAARGYARGVLPDGCVDIIWAPGSRLWIAGPDTAARPSSVPSGTALAGIRFLPGVAAEILGTPVSLLADRRVPLSDCWPHDASRSLQQRLDGAPCDGQIIAALEEATLRRTSPPPDPAVRLTVLGIQRRVALGMSCSGQAPWNLPISGRQLRRRFVAAVGYGPKRFERIMRFQHFLRLAGASGKGRGLATLAAEAGYADQAHLSRECASLAGSSPRMLMHD
ncbi:MAG TPA: helix-turn-helix domain-containing protein [Candidatus Binataceae bacterium]|nr:helix-turn-helix domain-containing protein [Candidatus Binataceae bacterium]